MSTIGVQPDTTLPKTPKIQIYTALLTQEGIDPPTSIVLNNTIGGTVIWTYDSPGVYTATLAGAFKEDRCYFTLCPTNVAGMEYTINRLDDNSIQLTTEDNEFMNKTPIEIRVYNI